MADNQQEKPEQKPQAAEEKKEEKKPTTLDSILNESSQAVKSSFNTSLGLGAIGGSTALFGLDGLVTAASFPIGGFIEKKLMKEPKPFTSKNFRDEAIAGALFTPPLWYGVNLIREIPKAYGLDGIVNILGASIPTAALAVGGFTLASIPLFNTVYYPLKYLIDNKTLKGIGKDFKENYWKGTKRSMLYLGLPWAATVAASVAIPAFSPFLFPVLAGFEVAYRVALSKENLNYWKLLNPFTYVPNFLNPFYLVSGAATATYKVGKGVFEAASAVGSTLYDKIKKFFKEITAPAPTPAPAPAGAK